MDPFVMPPPKSVDPQLFQSSSWPIYYHPAISLALLDPPKDHSWRWLSAALTVCLAVALRCSFVTHGLGSSQLTLTGPPTQRSPFRCTVHGGREKKGWGSWIQPPAQLVLRYLPVALAGQPTDTRPPLRYPVYSLP